MPASDHWDAIIAVGGVLLGSLLSLAAATLVAWRDRHYQRRVLLLTKLDDLAVEHTTLANWMNKIRTCQTLLDLQLAHPELPCSRMESLAALYFARLKQPVAQYTAALRAYYTWAFSQVSKFVQTDASFPSSLQSCLLKTDQAGADQHRKQIEACFRELADSVAAEAKRLLG